MTTDHLRCLSLIESITDYLDGALDGATQRSFHDHLADCADCVAAVGQFRRIIELAGHLADDDVAALDPHTRNRLLAAFREVRSPQ